MIPNTDLSRSTNRKVLFIAYHCPPDASVGSNRVAKAVKYLKRLGWLPYVVAVDEPHIALRDDGRLADLVGVPVARAPVWPTPLDALAAPWNWVRSVRRLGAHGQRAVPEGARDRRRPGGEPTWGERAAETARRYLRSILELPDQRVGWLLPAVWVAYRLVKREGIRVVVTSSPPPTTAVVGLVLAEIADIRLVTDLRDPWFSPHGRPARLSSRASDAIQRWLEGRIMRKSARVITTTEHYRDFLMRTYPGIPANRFGTVWNGYDEEDLPDLPGRRSRGPVRIAYVGTFYYGRTPNQFLGAVGDLVRGGVIPKTGIEIRFVGDVRWAEGESVEALARACGLAHATTIVDTVSHQEALREMVEADVLLLLAPDQYYAIPAKTFEYLAAGKRILCVAKEGATADFIRRSGAGVVVEPGDKEAMKTALCGLLAELRTAGSSRSNGDLGRYSSRKRAEDLSGMLEQCLVGAGSDE